MATIDNLGGLTKGDFSNLVAYGVEVYRGNQGNASPPYFIAGSIPPSTMTGKWAVVVQSDGEIMLYSPKSYRLSDGNVGMIRASSVAMPSLRPTSLGMVTDAQPATVFAGGTLQLKYALTDWTDGDPEMTYFFNVQTAWDYIRDSAGISS